MTDAPDEQTINLDGIRIMMTHGHNYGVKSTLTPIISTAVRNNVDILLFGHTHEGFEMTLTPENDLGIKLDKPLYIMNPGSLGSYAAAFGTISTDSSGRVLLAHGSLKD
jgi:predicted phosphodiesterase